MDETLLVGEIRINWLDGGSFELDGGAMFGVVPKALWGRKYESDESNCIKMINSPLLLRTPKANVLIETGLGNKLSEKQKKIFRAGEWDVPGSLKSLGLAPEDIDFVILTHCDFDHAGGIVTANGDGTTRLTFPNARHVIQRSEWEDVQSPNIRSSNTYWAVNFQPLIDSGEGKNLLLVDGEHEVTPGIRVTHTGGHTRGHQIVDIESGGQRATHLADLLPTHAHYHPLWVMAYDNFPMEVIALKQKLEARARDEDAWLTFYHDPLFKAAKFDEKGNITESFGAAEG